MYNKVFLIGNLTRDPDLRYTTSGIPVARLTLAVNRFKKKGTGVGEGEGGAGGQDVDFINVVAWRRLAEICGEFLKKGRPVAIEGRLQISSFTGRDGQKRTMAEVVADNMQMLGSKPGSGPMKSEAAVETTAVNEEDIPF
ncbi:MAG: single-stranded DNA-binding protein [bacterium]